MSPLRLTFMKKGVKINVCSAQEERREREESKEN